MGDFRVELKTVDRQRVVPNGGQRACGRAGQRPKIGRHLVDLIAVAHPDHGVGWHAGEERVGLQHLAAGAAVFAGLRPADVAAEGVAGQLHAVADAEHGNAEPEDARVAPRGAGLVDTRRTTREDNSLGSQRLDAIRGQIVADDLAVDMLLADATGDQLGVLRAEVEHKHPFRLLGGAVRRMFWRGVGDGRRWHGWLEKCRAEKPVSIEGLCRMETLAESTAFFGLL